MLVPFQLFPHSKVLSKSIIEPYVIMRFNKIFCESNHPLNCRKGRSGGTTLHAKWRVSMSDCSSFRVQDFLHSHLQRASLMCLILSCGRPASSLIESMSMPRSSITWVGPIVSSWAIADPQMVNRKIVRREQRFLLHSDSVGSHMMTSCRIWSTKLISMS